MQKNRCKNWLDSADFFGITSMEFRCFSMLSRPFVLQPDLEVSVNVSSASRGANRREREKTKTSE